VASERGRAQTRVVEKSADVATLGLRGVQGWTAVHPAGRGELVEAYWKGASERVRTP
jgi:hypothetical protein